METLFQDTELSNAKTHTQNSKSVSVLVPYPVKKAYDYKIPEGFCISIGNYVTVPFKNREVTGIVWEIPESSISQTRPQTKLKSIISRHDIPPMPKAHIKFLNWVARYNMAPLGSVLKLSLNTPKALEPLPPVKLYRITDRAKKIGKDSVTSLSPQRQKVLDIARDATPKRLSELAKQAGCSTSVVKGLVGLNLLETVETTSLAPCTNPNYRKKGVSLSQAQSEVAKTLISYVKNLEYKTALIDGVTGAGKTETYFEAVAKALENGKQVLILLPEIALSNAFIDRFRQRFGTLPALWHSSLGTAQRRITWKGVAQGDTKVVIGARSALFLPYQNLGLIIVDEEHDPAYKQDEGVIYNARDMAVVRASLGNFPAILVSATPSLETINNCWEGKYEHLKLPDRHGGAQLPDIHLIDMKKDKPESQHFISPTLKNAAQQALENNEQILFFLNRRGYAPLTLCRSCGHRFECPRCSAWLIEHRNKSRSKFHSSPKLLCHHCGYITNIPKTCPSCSDTNSFAACGPGVERIKEEAKELFPDARICVLSSDTAQTHEELKSILKDIKSHKIDIIIGTQIIAKGHHFPKLTCVGVIDADLGLSGGDLRASERVYQLLHQVAGRAGREKSKGHVYLQTFNPKNRIMQALASNDRDNFLETEADQREMANMPPFGRLAGIIISGRDENHVIQTAKQLGKTVPHGQGLQTLGPAEAQFYRLRGKYRYRFLVCSDKNIDIQKSILKWLENIKTTPNVKIRIDIDPQSFV